MVDGSGWVPPADFDPRTRIWYKKAMEQKKLIFTDPYFGDADKATNDTAAKTSIVSECAHDVGELANRLELLVGKFKV